MISKDKLFIVASNLDDSIKRQASLYEITLFKSFMAFETMVNSVPVTLDTLVISAADLAFNASNMRRAKEVLESPFLKLTGNVCYLVDESANVQVINQFFTEAGYDNWTVYQGDLSPKFILDIVSGERRQTEEVQTELVTYRIRAKEYIKSKEAEDAASNDRKYYTDDDVLRDIDVNEELQITQPSGFNEIVINYVVGDTKERTVLAFLLAQYRSLSGKTLICETDWEYHTLTDIVTKSGIACELIYMDEINDNITVVLERIKATPESLIVIGSRTRERFDYNFIMDILESNLHDKLHYLIRECEYAETPYGRCYTIVVPNTVSEVLRCCNKLKYSPSAEMCTFVGVQMNNLGPTNITSAEMYSIITSVLEINGLPTQTVRISGTKLKGDGVVYDVLGILNQGNRR